MPVIAMVEGSVWGGGCELVMSCDLIIASDDSTFALTPAKLGVPYNLSGALNFMKVADIHFIKEMLFTAQPITATSDSKTGVENMPINGSIASDATTVAGDANTFTLGATHPAHGSVVVNADGSYTYTPTTGYSGTDSFSYIVTDHSGYDYKKIVGEAQLVVDTRNATKGIQSPKVVRC